MILKSINLFDNPLKTIQPLLNLIRNGQLSYLKILNFSLYDDNFFMEFADSETVVELY